MKEVKFLKLCNHKNTISYKGCHLKEHTAWVRVIKLSMWPKQKIPEYSFNFRLGGTSCKPVFCNIFCSLHNLHVHLICFHTLHVQFVQKTKNIAKIRFM